MSEDDSKAPICKKADGGGAFDYWEIFWTVSAAYALGSGG